MVERNDFILDLSDEFFSEKKDFFFCYGRTWLAYYPWLVPKSKLKKKRETLIKFKENNSVNLLRQIHTNAKLGTLKQYRVGIGIDSTGPNNSDAATTEILAALPDFSFDKKLLQKITQIETKKKKTFAKAFCAKSAAFFVAAEKPEVEVTLAFAKGPTNNPRTEEEYDTFKLQAEDAISAMLDSMIFACVSIAILNKTSANSVGQRYKEVWTVDYPKILDKCLDKHVGDRAEHDCEELIPGLINEPIRRDFFLKVWCIKSTDTGAESQMDQDEALARQLQFKYNKEAAAAYDFRKELRDRAEDLGKQVADTKGAGDCLYYAAAQSLKLGTTDEAMLNVRETLANFFDFNQLFYDSHTFGGGSLKEFSPHGLVPSYPEHPDRVTILRNLKKRYKWGEFTYLQIIADCYNVDIEYAAVIKTGDHWHSATGRIKPNNSSGEDKDEAHTIGIGLWATNIAMGHFVSLLPP